MMLPPMSQCGDWISQHLIPIQAVNHHQVVLICMANSRIAKIVNILFCDLHLHGEVTAAAVLCSDDFRMF